MEQCIANCLVMTQAYCNPGSEAERMALRGSKHAFAMLEWVEQAGRTVDLAFKKSSIGQKIISNNQ